MEAKKAGQRLTLEEMFDIFEQDVYKEYREEHGIEILHDDKVGRYIARYPERWWTLDRVCPSILAFILAEQLLQQEFYYDSGIQITIPPDGSYSVEWEATLIQMWLHPLIWADTEFYLGHIILGHVAVPTYDESRVKAAYEVSVTHETFRVLFFADNIDQLTMPEDDLEHGFMKGMHVWSHLTRNSAPVYKKVFSGEMLQIEDITSLKLFSAFQLRYSIRLIAEQRGGKLALEILEMLKKEWPTLKLWKNALRNMTKEEIDEFEECLNHGFDDLLAEWETEAEQNTTRGPKETTMFKDKEMAERETKRFLSFINHHKMSEDDVDAAYDNRVNQVAVCFYRIWKEKNYLTTRACGTSLSRFIVDCGLSISVKEKAHGNVLNKMIKSNDLFANWIGEVRASFQN